MQNKQCSRTVVGWFLFLSRRENKPLRFMSIHLGLATRLIPIEDVFTDHPVRGNCQLVQVGDKTFLRVNMQGAKPVDLELDGAIHLIDDHHIIATFSTMEALEEMQRKEMANAQKNSVAVADVI